MKKILVIDDDSIMRGLLEKELSEAGYCVLVAGSGPEGVRIAQEQNPNLVLLDIMMPEMDGAETANLLRSDGRTKNTLIIYITSLVEESEVKDGFVEGSKIGNQYFIAKPFHTDELLKLVHGLIGEPLNIQSSDQKNR